jgi:hypothetical protein
MPLAQILNLMNLLKERVYIVQGALLHKIYADYQTTTIAGLNVKSSSHDSVKNLNRFLKKADVSLAFGS